jgi:hypothetical protein
MPLTTDQQRVKDLLTETITLLCKNGLNFKSQFTIEGLIGITIDQNDVFLISLHENVALRHVHESSDHKRDHQKVPATTGHQVPSSSLGSRSSLATTFRSVQQRRPPAFCAVAPKSAAENVPPASAPCSLMRALLTGRGIADGGTTDAPQLSADLNTGADSVMFKTSSCRSIDNEIDASGRVEDNRLELPHLADEDVSRNMKVSHGDYLKSRANSQQSEIIVIKEESISHENVADGLDKSIFEESTSRPLPDISAEYPLHDARQEFSGNNSGSIATDHSPDYYSSQHFVQHLTDDTEDNEPDFLSGIEVGCTLGPNPVHYTLVPGGNNRGGAAIVGSDGHRYGVKMVKPNVTYWRCVVRNRLMNCRAVVIQRGRTFVRGAQEHCHSPLNVSGCNPLEQGQPITGPPFLSQETETDVDAWPNTVNT